MRDLVRLKGRILKLETVTVLWRALGAKHSARKWAMLLSHGYMIHSLENEVQNTEGTRATL